jgi:alkanesulfonate monooxygenase SsuD/methylene tetrahydromethanopterin reductase-like flavin-dependent oxidoreductase (luciferase family)
MIDFALKLNIYGQKPGTGFDRFYRLAETADSLDYDGVYVVDHFILPEGQLTAFSAEADPERPYLLEAYTSLAAFAARTKKVRLGPQVSPIAFRHPSFIAKMAATLDVISDGRLVLQLGTGWHEPEFTAYGFPFDEEFRVRADKMWEGLEVIDRLFTEDGPVDFEGRYYRLDKAPLWPKPVQKPRPPIWFGGTSKLVRRAVAKHGQGWTPAAPHYAGLDPDWYAESLGEIRSMAEDNGRDPGEILPAALFMTSIAEDRDKAAAMASNLLRRPDWKDRSLDELRETGICIWGTPDDCVEALLKYVRAGIRYFSLSFIPVSDIEATVEGMRLYSEEVLPRLRDAASSLPADARSAA